MYYNDEAGRAAYLAGFHAAEALDLHRGPARESYRALFATFAGAGLRLRPIPKRDGWQRALAVPNSTTQTPSIFRRGVRWLWQRSLRRCTFSPRQIRTPGSK
jgi:hypothetical protein